MKPLDKISDFVYKWWPLALPFIVFCMYAVAGYYD
jgi:hypothetical protein